MKGMRNMAKKGTKIAVTYIVTILATFVIIGGIFWILMQNLLFPEVKEQDRPEIEPLTDTEEYVPSPDDSKTALFIFDSAKRLSGSCFMVVRMAVEDRRLVIMPIPSDTYALVDGSENSIYEFYRTGGTTKAVSAAESMTGLTIDYYVKLDNDSFRTFVDIFGGADADIPYNLIYEDPDTGEETVFLEGETYVTSEDMIKLFTYPLYNSGEEYRAKTFGLIVSELINGNISSEFANNIDNYFSMVINSSAETNFTAYDYSEQSAAMKYVAGNPEKVAKLVPVSGSYNENGLYVIDENFVKAIPEWMGIETYEE